jgi:hypothetical protein
MNDFNAATEEHGEVLTVRAYISKHYDSQVAFAKAHGVSKQRITEWIASGFIFIGDDMYSHRRRFELK